MWDDAIGFVQKLTFRKIINFLKLKFSYYLSILARKPVIMGHPAFATIEPTNLCNLRCPECPAGNNSLTRPRGYLDEDLFGKIIDELAPDLVWLMLYFQGEPMLHKHLPDFIRVSTSNKIYTVISTNGHFLTLLNSQKLIESGLDRITISLDGIDQETYTKYRKGGDFNTVISGIKNLVRMKKRLASQKPYIILQFLVMSHNEDQIERIKQLGKKLGVNKIVFKTMQITDFKSNKHFLPENKKFSRYQNYKDSSFRVNYRIPNKCSRLWNTLVIQQDGMTVPCCFDKDTGYPLGKFPDNTINNIWKGELFNGFRNKILNYRSKIPMCCNCTENGGKIFLK